jgi:hypothetical protein
MVEVKRLLAKTRLLTLTSAVDDVRLLRTETLTLITSNRLTESQRGSAGLLSSGHGFGLGIAVVLDPAKGGSDFVWWR